MSASSRFRGVVDSRSRPSIGARVGRASATSTSASSETRSRFVTSFKSGDMEGGARRTGHTSTAGSLVALIELADAVGDAKTCLLCVEDSHADCRRAIIAGAIAERLPQLADRSPAGG